MHTINSFKSTIRIFIFPKIGNYFTTTADQNKTPVAYDALCVTCNKNRIEYKNRLKRKVE